MPQTQDRRLDLDAPADVPGEALGDALARLLKVLERTGAQLSARRQDGLERAAFTLLFWLVHDGPMRSRTLADLALSDPSTVSRHVAHLVDLGLVERRADPDDGRATLLAATPDGVRLAAELRRRRNSTLAAVVADWTTVEQEQLRGLLLRFTDDLERLRPSLLAHCEAPSGGHPMTTSTSTATA